MFTALPIILILIKARAGRRKQYHLTLGQTEVDLPLVPVTPITGLVVFAIKSAISLPHDHFYPNVDQKGLKPGYSLQQPELRQRLLLNGLEQPPGLHEGCLQEFA